MSIGAGLNASATMATSESMAHAPKLGPSQSARSTLSAMVSSVPVSLEATPLVEYAALAQPILSGMAYDAVVKLIASLASTIMSPSGPAYATPIHVQLTKDGME